MVWLSYFICHEKNNMRNAEMSLSIRTINDVSYIVLIITSV